MGIIEELGEIQKLAKIELAAQQEEAQQEATRDIEEVWKFQTQLADSDLSKYLEEIKDRAKKTPHRTEATVSLGIVPRTYAERVTKNLEKEGFSAVLSGRYHKAQGYGDEGHYDAYTTYAVKVGWR